MQAKRCVTGALSLATGLLGFALPASASAAIEIGQTFDPSATGNCGTPDFTLLQTVSPSDQYAAPSPGVITAWSHQASASPPPLKLKVGRAAGGPNFTIVGESPLKAPIPNTVNTYTDVRIPVQAGDVIGFYLGADGPCARISGGTYRFHGIMGDVPPGATESLTFASSPAQFDVSATLEPDCDADGFGDETQDPAPACPRTLTFDASKNKVKKGKKVTLSGQVAETRQSGACAANQSVELQRKKPSQSAFTTFDQVQTDAAGIFSAKEKVKKTFEYRAEAPETATCAGQVSNTEKVKVKKPK